MGLFEKPSWILYYKKIVATHHFYRVAVDILTVTAALILLEGFVSWVSWRLDLFLPH
jgi:hypothetical protein